MIPVSIAEPRMYITKNANPERAYLLNSLVLSSLGLEQREDFTRVCSTVQKTTAIMNDNTHLVKIVLVRKGSRCPLSSDSSSLRFSI